MASKHTTNRSERDINKKFNLVEFNRIFEQNNLNFENKENKTQENKLQELPVKEIKTQEQELPEGKIKTQEQELPECNQTLIKSEYNVLLIIFSSMLIIGILLLLFNNFIRTDDK